jgi:hypothetical protein
MVPPITATIPMKNPKAKTTGLGSLDPFKLKVLQNPKQEPAARKIPERIVIAIGVAL